MTREDIFDLMEHIFSTGGGHSRPGNGNVAFALFAIADALENVAQSLSELGNNHSDTRMGAIENLSLEVRDGLAGLADAFKQERE